MSQNGKGDRARPFSVSQQQFEDNWDRIFNRIPKAELQPKTKKKPATQEMSDEELNKKDE